MTDRAPRLIRDPEVLEIIGHGRSKRDEMVREGTFPKPIKLGRKKVWLESEVIQWVRDVAARAGKKA